MDHNHNRMREGYMSTRAAPIDTVGSWPRTTLARIRTTRDKSRGHGLNLPRPQLIPQVIEPHGISQGHVLIAMCDFLVPVYSYYGG